MEIIRGPAAMTAWANRAIAQGCSIGLVPTMGFFHEGHLRLMRRAHAEADRLVVSLFVNPIQFGVGEDLGRYPRDFERDCRLAEAEGVEVLFAPEAEAMYQACAQTKLAVGALAEGLCGAQRPGHFSGVATVVAKLFNLVKPRLAVFGRKDFQQLAVIRQMAADLNFDVRIIGHPIVREPDGLAMSSRNSYLSAVERRTALCLYRAICHARQRVREGMVDAALLLSELRDLFTAVDGVVVEYLSLVDRQSLVPLGLLNERVVLVMAVRVGKTRLIDNDMLFEDLS